MESEVSPSLEGRKECCRSGLRFLREMLSERPGHYSAISNGRDQAGRTVAVYITLSPTCL